MKIFLISREVWRQGEVTEKPIRLERKFPYGNIVFRNPVDAIDFCSRSGAVPTDDDDLCRSFEEKFGVSHDTLTLRYDIYDYDLMDA